MKKVPILLLNLFICLFWGNSFSQKSVHIPGYLEDLSTIDGQQFSWSKTMESDNFIVIWGDSAGLDPLTANNPDLVFNPQMILDTMEWIYQQFEMYGFVDDAPGTYLSQYKVPVIMLNTFGPDGAVGWAFGGDSDGIIGTFWVHPLAMADGHVAAHEFAHSLQAQCVIDAREPAGLGYVWVNSGIFWETHANFMRNLVYPQDVTAFGMDVTHIETFGDWKNTYENYPLLFDMMETDGIEIVNRLWRESYSDEYPLNTYKRIMGYNQHQFNTRMYDYVKRMATYDFTSNGVGSYFRQYRENDLSSNLQSIQSTWTILDQDSIDQNHFRVPIYLAPEEYGYNIIPIHIDNDSCPVIIKFKGHTEVNAHGGWRYGFAAGKADGTISRYSPVYDQNTHEIAFQLEETETDLFFIVMGAPFDEITTNTTNDTWKGYPKHYRYPYDVYMVGGKPEGYQQPENFRNQLKNNGAIHANGGGWVESSASVSSSVYVGKNAIVLGNSVISGNVKITGTAIVANAAVSDNVLIKENALVIGGNTYGNAVIGGQTFLENNDIYDQAWVHDRARVSNYELHGNIEVGGDVFVYNEQGNCDNGVYYRMTNFYEDNLLECDNRDANHPANSDVNNELSDFSLSEMVTSCDCANYPECMALGINEKKEEDVTTIFPNPVSDVLYFKWNKDIGESQLFIFAADGTCVQTIYCQNSGQLESVNVEHLEKGVYILKLTSGDDQLFHSLLMIE